MGFHNVRKIVVYLNIVIIKMQLSFLPYLYPKDLQKLDDLGVLIEKLLIAQNQTISKLNQLIQILQKMINGTDAGNILIILCYLRD